MYYLIITKKDNICNTQFSKENRFLGQQGVGTKEKASHKTCFPFVSFTHKIAVNKLYFIIL